MTKHTGDFARRRAVVAGTAVALSALPLLARSAGTASSASPTTAELANVVERLIGRPVDSIQPAPVAGLYEVAVGNQVLYIDATGHHVFDGHLVEVDTRTSLTARRQAELERASLPRFDWSGVDFGDAIKTVHGRELPGRALLVFEDPRCAFCRRLHETLATMRDLVVYTVPVSFLGPASREANEAIWCATDRAAAWDLAMKGQPVPKNLSAN